MTSCERGAFLRCPGSGIHNQQVFPVAPTSLATHTQPSMDSRAAQELATSHGVRVEKFRDARLTWPREGQHVLGCFDDDGVVVYQAFNDAYVQALTQAGFSSPLVWTLMSRIPVRPCTPTNNMPHMCDTQHWEVCRGTQKVCGRTRLSQPHDMGQDEFLVDDVSVSPASRVASAVRDACTAVHRHCANP